MFLVLGQEPVGEVKDHAGKEPGLGQAEQEAHRDDRPWPLHERRGGGDETPGGHDPGDPQPCPEALQRHVARDLQQEVAEEEYAGAPAEHRGGQPEVAVHPDRGEIDVHPIQEGDEVGEDQERREPPADASHGRPLQRGLDHDGAPFPQVASSNARANLGTGAGPVLPCSAGAAGTVTASVATAAHGTQIISSVLAGRSVRVPTLTASA